MTLLLHEFDLVEFSITRWIVFLYFTQSTGLGQMVMFHVNFIFFNTYKNNQVYLVRVYDTASCYARLSRFL